MLLVLGSALTIFFWGKWMGRIITTAYHDTYKLEPLQSTMKISMIFLAVSVMIGAACSTIIYHYFLMPMATQALASVTMQPGSDLLLKSVNEFMNWGIYLVMGAIVAALLVSLIGLRKVRPAMPFLCGENYRTGPKTFEFRSAMDEGVLAQVTSYYFAPWFGERNMTQWANPIAILILLSLFARIGVL
jgi:ech hydrogenase subunit A